MSNINDFYSIGNLALYDNWSPNYVYFNSLRRADMVFKNNTYWNAQEADKIAKTAIAHAEAHTNLYGVSDELNLEYFKAKFLHIIHYLDRAIAYEKKNELNYFKQKYNNLKSTFTEKELKTKPLSDLVAIFKDPSKFKYKTFISAINVLMSGSKNAKIIAEHESKRIKEIDTILQNLLTSRQKQVAGLADRYNKSYDKKMKMIEEATERLQDKITTEYVKTKQLTRKHNGKYVLFGGKQFKDKIKGPIANVLGQWAESVLDEILQKPSILQEIVTKMNVNYPINDGNFNHLESEIRDIIILAIIQYGLNNLNTVLNKELNSIIVSEVEKTLTEDTDIFDTVSQYNIKNLSGAFQKTSNTELFNESKTVLDLAEKRTTELFKRIDTLVKKQKALSENEQNSYLITALKSTSSSRNQSKTAYKEVEDVIELIDSINDLYNEIQTILNNWKKTASDSLEKTVFLNKNKDFPLTITIKDGEVQVDMKSLINYVSSQEGYKYLNYTQFNPTSVKSMLTSLKRQASLKLRQTLIDSVKSTIKSGACSLTEQELISMMGKELQNITIDINGPTVAEILPGISFRASGKSLIIDWNGKIKGKNDMVVIEVKTKHLVKKFKAQLSDSISDKTGRILEKYEKTIQEAQENFLDLAQEKSDKLLKSLTESNDQQKYSKMWEGTVLNMHRLRDKEHEDLADAQAEITKAWRGFKRNISPLIRNKHDEETLDKIREKELNVLANSFQITTTVKSYNTYMNSIGFGGGSLGGNLRDQLTKIQKLFESADIKMNGDDIEWLYSSIINCFPGSVVKEKNKNLIEHYLGSIVAFALFDEGGAEEKIIGNMYETLMDDIKKSQSHADILHLYAVNGIYVPGSYVLQKTAKELEKVYNEIEKIPKATRQGAGVTIVNKASESMIPNRPISKGPSVPDPWAVTGERVASSTSIKILFLAGLLDIVNSINEELSDVEII